MTASINKKPALVLYTDDDQASVLMAEAALVAAGYDFLAASSGEEAVQMFIEHQPDLVVMDALMPGIDGFEAIRRIRILPAGLHTPILMATGLDDLESITAAYDEGATDFLTKPVNFHLLPHRLSYMLRAHASAHELRRSQESLSNAQRIARIGSWEISQNNSTVELSDICRKLLCLPDGDQLVSLQDAFCNVVDPAIEEIQGKYLQSIKDGTPFNAVFTVACTEQRREFKLRVEAEPVLSDEHSANVVGTLQDITEISNAQQQIHMLAYYDVVTELPNRAFLYEKLSYALAVSERANQKFALLFLDLDHFKQVNDTLGHDVGDELLKQASTRLGEAVREHDTVTRARSGDYESKTASESHTVARLGGDEFVVLITNIATERDAAVVARRIGAVIAEPFDLSANTVNITTTIGISVYPDDGRDSETLLKHSDIALYHAKEKGRNSFQFYSREIHDASMARFSLEKKLKIAIDEELLDLVYQPKIDLKTGAVVGVEALVRWYDEECGNICPAEFIPLAEETGLIIPLGRWVMLKACLQMQKWVSQGLAFESVAINCSTVQFVRSDMTQLVAEVLQESGIAAQLLEIELTESLLLQDTEQGIEILNNLKERGVQVSIDDFGTGFSSLSYLKKLPVDKLKIDHSFVRDLVHDSGDQAITSAIITLSHKLGLIVVAEGVENFEQCELLAEMGCDQMQGYLVSKPLTATELENWLHKPLSLEKLRKAS